jgi:multidrug efflux system membrane fusion protein
MTNGKMQMSRVSLSDSQRVQTNQTQSSTWWIWLVIVASIVVVGLLAWGVTYRIMHPAAAAGAGGAKSGGKGGTPVVVAKVRKGNLDLYLNGLGTVTPLNSVSIHTRVDGQLDQVNYVEGQLVKAGDLLAEIDPRPFQAMLTQAQGQLVRDQALLKDAQLNLDRFKSVFKEGNSVTQAQVDTQQALVNQYQGTVTTDNGIIQGDQVNIAYCRITAPFDGRIGLRLVDPGNIVHAADTNALAVITQIQPITLLFTLSEDDLGKVMPHVDPKNPLLVEAWDRDLTTKLATGKLLAVDNQVDPTTGTVKLRALFENQKNELYPNEFANARIRYQTLHDVLLVPSAAVQRGPDSIFSYVVINKAVEIRTITVGQTEGGQTVITSGLSAGDVVVTDGVDKLQKGTAVTVRERAGRKGAATQSSSTQPGEGEPTTAPGSGATTRPGGKGHRPKQGDAE